MIKINKTDASWLKKAVAKDAARDALCYVQVSDSNRWGHIAAATDGHRLHVVEVDASIPNGLYIPYATGELKPTSTTGRYPDIQSAVAPDTNFRFPCDHLDKCQLLDTGRYESQPAYAFGKLTLSVKLCDEAVSNKLPYRIDAQEKPTHPAIIRFMGKRNHFALIMPMRPIN